MRVLSLFDGISCGQVALERAGIQVDEYYASEIESRPIEITQKNYPNTIQLGDITKINSQDLPYIDLIIGGSPCQGFSFAGKQLNFNDDRSKLFFEFVRLVKELRPKYFLLENVKMKQEYQDVISEQLGVKPIEINSSLVSAQQRRRLYWTNIPNVIQPEDKKIYLKDIIEYGLPITDKAYCLKVSGIQGLTLKGFEHYLKTKQDNFILKNKPERLGHFNSGGQGDRVYSINGKSVCLSALGGGRGAKTGLYFIEQRGHGTNKGGVRALNGKVPSMTTSSWEHNNKLLKIDEELINEDKQGIYTIASRGRNIVDGKRKDVKGAKTEQRLETSFFEKSNCLTSVQKDSLLLDSTNIPALVRKLTPIECERLQTLPDNYTEGISNTQRIKTLGNGWTVDVVAHIFKGLQGEYGNNFKPWRKEEYEE